MKKLLLLLTIILLSISCEKKATHFEGFGALNIGTDFNSLGVSNSFRNVMEGEFYADHFLLSDKIGLVADLNVATDNDKISEVKFSNTEATNMTVLEKELDNLEEVQLDKNGFTGMLNENVVIKMYNTNNENVYLSVFEDKNKRLKNGQPVYEFSYIHKEAAIKNHNLMMKRIGKSHNKKLLQ